MPAPTTRRAFLTKGLTLLAAGGTVPSFVSRTAFAVGDPFDLKNTQVDSGVDGKILVVCQLSGGNDGLNTVIPFADDAYHRNRANIGFRPDAVLKATDYIGFNPSLAPLKQLYDDGWMSVVQGVGYPNPDRSHFRSMDIWHTANPKVEAIRSGWLGRYFDSQCTGIDPKGRPENMQAVGDPQAGISLGETNLIAMQGEVSMPLSLEDVRDYQYRGGRKEAMAALQLKPSSTVVTSDPSDPHTEAGQLDFLTRTAMDAQVSSERVITAVENHKPPVDYPRGKFGEGLRMTAAMIKGGMPTRVYYVSLGGFDTHAQQRGRHDQLMREFAGGVAAFMADLKQQGNDERVAVMTFSEFGRRVKENASGGTDHGAAAPMFFFGKRVNPGILGTHPSLDDLDSGDLKYHVDFRTCYASVLHSWLDCDPETISRILGGAHELLPLLRG